MSDVCTPPGRPYAAQLASTTYYALTVGVPLGVGVLFAAFGVLALFYG
jgi:hypothetical protein